jgi:glycosidase
MSLCRLLLVVALALGAAPTGGATEALRVDPPFWWVGMREPALQLMVHAKGISDARPKLEHPGVRLVGTRYGDSPNYLFIDLALAPDTEPGKVRISLLRPDRRTLRFDYELRRREPGSAEREGFGSADLIYLLVPDRFANGDRSNDVVRGTREARVDRTDPGARHGGDIAGMQAALPYLAELGVTQIWPTPLIENDMATYSYHGYAATDHYLVDPRYGSNEDFVAFVRAARARGIGVIQDIVLNHIGSGHHWMADLPTRDWLNFGGRFSATTHARTTLRDPYAADADRRQFNDGWFVETMPDLNQRQPLLATYLTQMSIWWIEYAGLSGIREDTYSYADADYLSDWARRVRHEYPNFNIVGEEWSGNPVIVSYWQAGQRHAGHQPHTPSMMDFPLYYALLSGLKREETWESGLKPLYSALMNDVLYPDPYNLVLFEGNHDTSRLYSLLDEDYASWQMAIAYLMTAPRIPQLFYGTEVLLTSPKVRDDGKVRANFPGGWRGDAVNAFSGAGLTERQRDAQSFVRKLANFRKQTPALHRGKLTHFFPDEGTYVYFRHDQNTIVMVAINKEDKARELDAARFAEVLPNAVLGRDVITGSAVEIGSKLTLPARSVRIVAFPRRAN